MSLDIVEISLYVCYGSMLPLMVGGMVVMIVSWWICGLSKVNVFHFAAMAADMFLLIDDFHDYVGNDKSIVVLKVFWHLMVPIVNILLIFWLCANIKRDWRKPKLPKQKNSVNDW